MNDIKNIIFDDKENIMFFNKNIIHNIYYYFIVLVISKLEICKYIFEYKMNDFLEKYPQFKHLDEDELKSLLKFRNYLKCLLLIIPAKANKQKVFQIVPLLVGENNRYVTGGGQKLSTCRRVDIYNTEGDTLPSRRGYFKNLACMDKYYFNKMKRTKRKKNDDILEYDKHYIKKYKKNYSESVEDYIDEFIDINNLELFDRKYCQSIQTH
jgi:hypothetical protein